MELFIRYYLMKSNFMVQTKIVRVSREGSTVFGIDVTGLEDWVRIVKG